jgi:hypothetical protein
VAVSACGDRRALEKTSRLHLRRKHPFDGCAQLGIAHACLIEVCLPLRVGTPFQSAKENRL